MRVVPAQPLRIDSNNDQHVYNAAKNNVILKRQKRRIILEDSSSDDEDVDDKDNAITTINDDDDERKAKQVVTKRNKMDIRVAKKRKAKAIKEMEIANILHSKDWKKNGMSAAAAETQKDRKNMEYGISDALLSNLEAKYCLHSGNDKKKKKKRKQKVINEALILRK
jgi:hypothetical protein